MPEPAPPPVPRLSAQVDHHRLAGLDPDTQAWQDALDADGLTQVRRDAAPAPLRALLSAHTPTRERAIVAALATGLLALASAAAWAHGAGALIYGVSALGALLGALAIWTVARGVLEPTWPAVCKRPAPWTPEAARDRALSRLAAAPFVQSIDGVLVENVPALSHLKAWSAELDAFAARAQARRAEIEAIDARMAALQAALRPAARDVHRPALRERVASEAALEDRARRLRADVDDRIALIEQGLVALRQQAELEALRDHGRALLGQAEARVHAADALATTLEMDLAPLADDLEAVRALAQDEARRAAVRGETSALTTLR